MSYPDATATDGPAGYPAAWEADVVLHDGSTARVRPIRPRDADALQAFHVGQSERSTYLRFFAPLGRLSDRDLERLVTVDHRDRVALVALAGSAGEERIIGVARYDRIDPDTAEVAFNIADARQGLGLASVLLEHLAAAARERGVRRFVAEVLPQNGRMISVFREAGYEVRQRTEDGVVAVSFGIDPTDRSQEVMADREHRAEARSMRALLESRSVVVVGPGTDDPRPLHVGMVTRVLAGLAAAATSGAVVVHATGVPAESVAGTGASWWPDLDAVPGPVDLAAVAVAGERAEPVVRALSRLSVRAVVLLSSGFAEDGAAGLERQRRLLRTAHGAGMRMVGPASYGVLATGPDGTLDVSLARSVPGPGGIGLFCQSAPFSVALLAALEHRNLGLSQFVSAGHRADVSGNDLMQFWAEDEQTVAVGLHMESVGNPRKFSRVARRLAAVKPVVVMTAGRSGQVVPPGHAVRATQAPARVLSQVMRQSGVIRVDNTHQMFDVLQLVAHQPLPAGRRTGILASSASAATLVAELAATHGLRVGRHVSLVPEDAAPEVLDRAVHELYDEPDLDAVIAVRIPVVDDLDPRVARAVAQAAARTGRPTVAVMAGLHGITDELTALRPDGTPRTVPAYATPADAVLALGHAARYARWRASDRGAPLHPSGFALRAARRLVDQWLPPDAGHEVQLGPERTAQLLACAGIAVQRTIGVHDADSAVAAADELGWPVAVKTTVPALRHRADLGGVRLDVGDEAELRADVAEVLALAASLGPSPAGHPLEVQSMAPHGSACVIRSAEDPLFGPVISFGLAGDATDLLGDTAYGVPPLTDVDVGQLVRTPRTAPRLFGYRGLPALDVAALEDVVARVSVLADGLPELRRLELNPVVVAEHGAVVLAAAATLAHADRSDATRRLPRS